MATERDTTGHGEFSGGAGLIDPQMRVGRLVGNASGTAVLTEIGQELREIYALDPAKSGQDLATVQLERP